MSPISDEWLEYTRSNAAIAANADAAYRAGATGRGIRIAVIDSGITTSLAEFAGRIDPASADMVGPLAAASPNKHGTAVAALALAARDGAMIHGLAFEATLVAFNVSVPGSCTATGCRISSVGIVRAIDAAVLSGARIINMSLGADRAEPEVLDAVRRAAAAGVIFVLAAGNEDASQPGGGAMAVAQAGAGHVIIAGAHDAQGRFARGSNRAGPAAAVYLTALGVDVATIYGNGAPRSATGTSYSTAVISGAAALVAQARPDLTGAQIVSVLLDHATDAGSRGKDRTYGKGILNLASVFKALGLSSRDAGDVRTTGFQTR